MFVYLKESELYRKLFINKNFKQETVKLIFSRETPVHEVKDESLATAIAASFPKYLEVSKNKPVIRGSKEEKPEPIPAPAPVEEPKEEVKEPVQEEPVKEETPEPVAPVEEKVEEKVEEPQEAPKEEKKETKKNSRRRRSL